MKKTKTKSKTTAQKVPKGSTASMDTDATCVDCGCACECGPESCECGCCKGDAKSDCGDGCDCGNGECGCKDDCCDCGPEMEQDPETALRDAASDVWMKLFMDACAKEWQKTYGKDIAKAAKQAVKESKEYWEKAMPKKGKD
jgi:hypothetical protein